MDRTAYPFNGAAPKKSRTVTGAESKTFSPAAFPSAGAGEPLRGLALTLADEKMAKEWCGARQPLQQEIRTQH
jgi:hypothetical protein